METQVRKEEERVKYFEPEMEIVTFDDDILTDLTGESSTNNTGDGSGNGGTVDGLPSI